MKRRRIRLLLGVVVMTAAAVGCVDSVAGHAVKSGDGAAAHVRPQVPRPAPYAAMLGQEDRSTVTYNAEIRAIDPCGYVDSASLGKLGKIRKFTANDSQTGCDIAVAVDDEMAKSLEIGVSIIPTGSTYERDSRIVTVAGRRILENTDKYPGRPSNATWNFCYNLVPFSDRSVVKVAVKRYTSEAACSEAHTIVEGVVPLLEDRPQRADSTKDAFHAISVRDPCDLLLTVGPGHRVTLNQHLGPWECHFTLDGDDVANYYMVELAWHPKAFYDNPPPDVERLDIAGHPATQTRSQSICTIEVAVGDPNDGVKYDPVYNPDSVTNVVSATASTCDNANAAAAAAVTAFLD